MKHKSILITLSIAVSLATGRVKGGHFAVWEQPELFSEEIRAAFRSLR